MAKKYAKVGSEIRVQHNYSGTTKVKHGILVSLASQTSGTARIGHNTAVTVTRTAGSKTWTW
jgi:hypothetical protein